MSSAHHDATSDEATAEDRNESTRVPHESLGRLSLRFLKFGSLAWGGPVAQIAMIRKELVTMALADCTSPLKH